MSKRKPKKPPSDMTDDEAMDYLFTKRGSRQIKKQTERDPRKPGSPRKTRDNG